MPDLDDRIRSSLEGLARMGDEGTAVDLIAKRKRRWRRVRRAQTGLLSVTALAMAGAATFGLVRAFSHAQPAFNAAPRSKGGLIAFVGNVEPVYGCMTCTQVMVMNPDGTHVHPIAPSRWRQRDPAWSPDGSRLAFVQRVPNKGASDIWIVGADGTNPEPITHCRYPRCDWIEAPAWSPDGSKIAFVLGREPGFGPSGVFVMNASGSSPRLVARFSEAHGSSLAWSPDGSRIAFDEDVTKYLGAIEVVGADGSDRRILTQLRLATDHCGSADCYVYNGDPAWSPDGARIAFDHSVTDGAYQTNSQIFVVNEDGSDPHPLLQCSCRIAEAPSWSPDGTQLLFDQRNHNHKEIYVADADGTHISKLRTSHFSQCCASWQPVPAPSGPSLRTPNLPGTTPTPSVPSEKALQEMIGPACNATKVTGDFDGDGREDVAVVFVPRATCAQTSGSITYRLFVAWSSGSQRSWPVTNCSPYLCRAYGAPDLDGDGTAELSLEVDEGASEDALEFYRLGPHDPSLRAIVDRTNAPLKLWVSGSLAHQGWFRCAAGKQPFAALYAELDFKTNVWNVIETPYAFNGATVRALSQIRSRIADGSLDQGGPDACWVSTMQELGNASE